MLIRLISHAKNNPEHVDKMIWIDGLPEEWIFERREDTDEKGQPDERLFLKSPWEADITENIPEGIRYKFQPDPIEVWYETPQEIRPGTMVTDQKISWIRWIKKIHGVRLNIQSLQGEQMWKQIEDLLDRETPRNLRIPEPSIVGNKMYWTLTAETMPRVKLTGSEVEVPEEQVHVIQPKPEPRPNEFACQFCGDVFEKQRAKWMHERRKHGNKESFVSKQEKAVA